MKSTRLLRPSAAMFSGLAAADPTIHAKGSPLSNVGHDVLHKQTQEFKALSLLLHMLLRSNEYSVVFYGTIWPNYSEDSHKDSSLCVPATGM
jgi:hypothetical protein